MANLIHYGSCTLNDDGCTTCGDVTVPVEVVRLMSERTALCEDRVGHRAEIMIDFTPNVEPGDVLLVHIGVAIVKIHPTDTPRASA